MVLKNEPSGVSSCVDGALLTHYIVKDRKIDRLATLQSQIVYVFIAIAIAPFSLL